MLLRKPQLQTTSGDPISVPHLTWVHFTTQDILLCTLNYALSRVTSVPPSLLSLMTYYVRSSVLVVSVYPRSSRRSYVYSTLHKSTVPGISILLCVFLLVYQSHGTTNITTYTAGILCVCEHFL